MRLGCTAWLRLKARVKAADPDPCIWGAAGAAAAQAGHRLVSERHREDVAAGAAGHAGCQGARARRARRQVVGLSTKMGALVPKRVLRARTVVHHRRRVLQPGARPAVHSTCLCCTRACKGSSLGLHLNDPSPLNYVRTQLWHSGACACTCKKALCVLCVGPRQREVV